MFFKHMSDSGCNSNVKNICFLLLMFSCEEKGFTYKKWIIVFTFILT